MVISLHTPVADVAVSTLWQSDNLAERTECLRVECFHQRVELYLPVRLDVARIWEPDRQEDEQVSGYENQDKDESDWLRIGDRDEHVHGQGREKEE